MKEGFDDRLGLAAGTVLIMQALTGIIMSNSLLVSTGVLGALTLHVSSKYYTTERIQHD